MFAINVLFSFIFFLHNLCKDLYKDHSKIYVMLHIYDIISCRT